MKEQKRIDCGDLVQVVSGVYFGIVGKVSAIYKPVLASETVTSLCEIRDNCGRVFHISCNKLCLIVDSGNSTQTT